MDKPKFVYVTYIATTPEKLWAALTNADFTQKYWNNVRVQSDWKMGSSIKYADARKTWWEGEILEAEPPRHLSYTFCVTDSGEGPSRVVFEIEPEGNIVKLTLTHFDFEPTSKVLPRISTGWPQVLSNLKTLLESGSPLPDVGWGRADR